MTLSANNSIFAAGKKTGTAAALTTFTNAGVTNLATAATPNSFVIGAVGVVDINYPAMGTASAFNINEAKKLIQVQAGY